MYYSPSFARASRSLRARFALRFATSSRKKISLSNRVYFVPEFFFLVRYWGFVPSIGLPPHVHFVPFFPFGRSFLPPLSVITSHALFASFVVAIFVFFPFLFAPLRFAFFKVKKTKRPLFFQR